MTRYGGPEMDGIYAGKYFALDGNLHLTYGEEDMKRIIKN